MNPSSLSPWNALFTHLSHTKLAKMHSQWITQMKYTDYTLRDKPQCEVTFSHSFHSKHTHTKKGRRKSSSLSGDRRKPIYFIRTPDVRTYTFCMDAMRGCTQELRVEGCDAAEHGKSIKTFATPLFSVEVSQVKSNTHNSLEGLKSHKSAANRSSGGFEEGENMWQSEVKLSGKVLCGEKGGSAQIESARATLLAFWDRPNIVLGFVGSVGSPPCQVVFWRTFTDTHTPWWWEYVCRLWRVVGGLGSISEMNNNKKWKTGKVIPMIYETFEQGNRSMDDGFYWL